MVGTAGIVADENRLATEPGNGVQANEHVVQGACPHDCPDTCSLRVTVRDGRVTRVQGNPDHPMTNGSLCTKVARYEQRTYHPERVLQPQRRVGPKGAGRFESVTWDEALRDIAQRLKTIAADDPQGILPYSYGGTMGLVQGEAMAGRFFNRLGASQLARTICASAGAEGMTATYGANVGMRVEQFANSRLIVIWGSNSIASNLHFWSIAQTAKRTGAKLICIDPRLTATAEKCHQHIAPLPGTDGALALALMHQFIEQNWLDHEYIERHVRGWPALRERALAWPPERAAAVCGVSPVEIQNLARDYALLRPASIRLNYGMQRVRGGGNAVRLIALLPCLTGAWRDAAGGVLLSSSGWRRNVVDKAALQRPDLLAGRQPRTINMSAIGEALLQPASPEFGPRVQAVVVYNSNPVAVAPQSPQVAQGFARDDVFTVVLEHFMTDTADYADYVLPATTQLEHWDVVGSYGHTDIVLNRPAIPPLGEAKPNAQIFRELAAHMGFDEPCFRDDDQTLIRQALRDVDLDTLFKQGWVGLPVPQAPFAEGGFPTDDGRAHADHPRYGVADFLPNYESAHSTPQLAQRYPLAMISPPARHFLNSTFVNVKSLRDIEGEPLAELHPDDAAARGIADGQMVKLFNDRGEYHCRARVCERARPGVVNALGIWWRKLGPNGANPNELTHQRLTDLGEAATFYDCLVEVTALHVAGSREFTRWVR